MNSEQNIARLSADKTQEIEQSISLFSNSGKTKREIWVVTEFLRNLGVSFKDSELTSGSDPPDVIFQDAAFEIKEIDEENRKRGDEYKDKLEKARSAKTLKEMNTPRAKARGFKPSA